MTSSKAKRISKISADIARIEKSFFRSDDPDLRQRYYELQRKREHLLRSIILELHLSIENIITGAIGNELLQGRLIRSPAGHAIRDLLEDDHALGFRHKLLLARSLNLITRAEFTDLAELNTVRNRCSHNWQLNKVTRKKLTPFKSEKANFAISRHQSVPDRCVPQICRAVQQTLPEAFSSPCVMTLHEKISAKCAPPT